MDFNLDSLSADELYELGTKIGACTKERPDITHRIMLGVRDGLGEVGVSPTISGDVLWGLWRHWYHVIKDGCMKVHPPIHFISIMQPSGTGRIKK